MIPDRHLGTVAREAPAEGLSETAAAAGHDHHVAAADAVARNPIAIHDSLVQ
jgi:hypothetical protein